MAGVGRDQVGQAGWASREGRVGKRGLAVPQGGRDEVAFGAQVGWAKARQQGAANDWLGGAGGHSGARSSFDVTPFT